MKVNSFQLIVPAAGTGAALVLLPKHLSLEDAQALLQSALKNFAEVKKTSDESAVLIYDKADIEALTPANNSIFSIIDGLCFRFGTTDNINWAQRFWEAYNNRDAEVAKLINELKRHAADPAVMAMLNQKGIYWITGLVNMK